MYVMCQSKIQLGLEFICKSESCYSQRRMKDVKEKTSEKRGILSVRREKVCEGKER